MKRWLIGALALTFTLSVAVAQEQTTPPAPAAPRQANVPQPSEKILANGLRVIVVEKKGLPLVAASLMIKTGGEADPADHAGLADLTASLLTKGTRTKSAEEIARGVEALGATINSGAGWDESRVELNALSTTFTKAMGYVADVVRNATFTQEEIDRLREQNIDSLRVEMRQPPALARFVATRVLFGEAPYGHNLGGTPESLTRITRGDVTKFHRTYYRPDNAVLIIAGDIAPSAAFSVAQQLFGDWKKPAEKLPATKAATESKAAAPRVVVVDLPDAGQAAVIATRRGIRRVDEGHKVALVTNSILGGGYSSRLNQEIRIKRGLSYGARSEFDMRRTAGAFSVSTQTKNESAAEVAGIILDEMGRMAAASVPETELTPRKAVLIGNFGRSLETNPGLVGRIATLALYGLSLDEINKYVSAVQAVGSADVQKFASTHLLGNDTNIVIVGDAKKFIDPLKQRFKEVEVIAVDQLDLNAPTLRKK